MCKEWVRSTKENRKHYHLPSNDSKWSKSDMNIPKWSSNKLPRRDAPKCHVTNCHVTNCHVTNCHVIVWHNPVSVDRLISAYYWWVGTSSRSPSERYEWLTQNQFLMATWQSSLPCLRYFNFISPTIPFSNLDVLGVIVVCGCEVFVCCGLYIHLSKSEIHPFLVDGMVELWMFPNGRMNFASKSRESLKRANS